MAWIWDSHPTESVWGYEKAAQREHRDPLSRFLVQVDGMLFVATAALVVCLATLLFG